MRELRADCDPEHTEQTLRAAAEACYCNADSLHTSATLLQQQGPWHHALVFSSIGLEQFGKAIVFTVAAIRTAMRDRLPKRIADHRTNRYFASLARETTSGLEEFIAELAEQPLATLLRSSSQTALDYYATGGRGMSAPEWREAALYVDLLPDGSITDPRKFSMAHAGLEVDLLRATLHKYRALPAILSDTHKWTEFTASVHSTVNRPRSE